MEAIEKLMHGRTTIMIAHRLSTLEKCDIVLVMRDGKLTMITNSLDEAKLQLIQAESITRQQGPSLGQGPSMGPILVG
jgi:ABC-type bacteriocin/lantibiotic exporter with double-glycine peptidase domain